MIALSAGVQGSEHAALGLNYQDAHIVIQNDNSTVMVLCDGVSGGNKYRDSHNEVGAWLQASIVANTMAYYAGFLDLEELPDALDDRLMAFYRQHLKATNPPDPVLYASNYLSATLLVAVIRKDKGIVIASGDGLIQMDNDLLWIDEGGAPNCPVYRLWRDAPLKLSLFPENWHRVALMSDGMYPRKQRDDSQFDETRFRTMVEPYLWQATASVSLKRQLNAWQREDHPYFYDDATVALAYRETP